MSGAIMIVASRSRFDGIVRAAMTPGMAHAKLESNGMKARPEQNENLRQEHQYAAGPGDDAIQNESAQRPGGHHRADRLPQRGDLGGDEVHRRPGPAEHGLEHQKQHDRQQKRARDRIEHYGVEAREHGDARRYSVIDCVENPSDLALRRLDIGSGRGCGCFHTAHGLREAVLIDGFDQRTLSTRTDRYGLDDGYSQGLLECLAVQPVASLLRDVTHVQSDEHRAAYALEIEDQPQVQTQIGGVHDAYEKVWRRL
jgi:hypothetical protein